MDEFKQVGVGIGGTIAEGVVEGVKKTIVASENLFPIVNKAFTNLALSSKNTWDSINAGIDATNAKITEFDQKFAASARATQNNAMAMQAVMNAFALQVANAFAGGTASVGQFASQVMGIIGDLLIQLGTFAIIGSNLMEAALIPIVGAAAGLAAIAVGGAMKGLAQKFMSEGVQTFATGGIISGPTLGLMGEYSGARHNPEVVAPLDKLKSMIGSNGSQNLSGEFVVRGQDLVVALQRAERNRNRFK